MLYKINIRHDNGCIEDKFTNDFAAAEKTVKEDICANHVWITEFKLQGHTYESTSNAWQYLKANDEFHRTEHKVF